MSTAGHVVSEAYREGNFIPIGSVPNEAQMAEGLARLAGLTHSLLSVELGFPLRQWPVNAQWAQMQEQHHPRAPRAPASATLQPWRHVPSNVRLYPNTNAPVTLFLPEFPKDGSRVAVTRASGSASVTLNANGRRIDGAGYVTLLPADTRVFIFREDLGEWVRIPETFTEDAEMPFSAEFDDLWITGLAMRLAPRYGIDLPQSVTERYADMLTRAAMRYKEGAQPVSAAALRNEIRAVP